MRTRIRFVASQPQVKLCFRVGDDAIEARLTHIQRDYLETSGVSVCWILRVELGWRDWCVVDARRAFHLAPEHRGQALRPFVPERPLLIELRLRSPRELSALADRHPDALAAELLADPAHALLDAACWYAATVTQAVPGPSRMGFRTSWAEEHGPLGAG